MMRGLLTLGLLLLALFAAAPTAQAWTCLNDPEYGDGTVCVGFDQSQDTNSCDEFCVNVHTPPNLTPEAIVGTTDVCVKGAHDTRWVCAAGAIAP